MPSRWIRIAGWGSHEAIAFGLRSGGETARQAPAARSLAIGTHSHSRIADVGPQDTRCCVAVLGPADYASRCQESRHRQHRRPISWSRLDLPAVTAQSLSLIHI